MPARTVEGVFVTADERTGQPQFVLDLGCGILYLGDSLLFSVVGTLGRNVSRWQGRTLYVDITPDTPPDNTTAF